MSQYYDEPPQGQQQYRTPYGESRDEGTIEETIHRRAVKRMDHSRSPGRMPEVFTSRGRGGVIVALIAMAVSAAALTFTFVSRSSADTQISRLQSQVATMNSELARTADTSTVNGLTGKVTSLENAMGAVGQFSTICSQDLTGPNGPAQFFFMCTDQKPAGG
jgi:hypothetical protein